jgi:hypothetical protein
MDSKKNPTIGDDYNNYIIYINSLSPSVCLSVCDGYLYDGYTRTKWDLQSIILLCVGNLGCSLG